MVQHNTSTRLDKFLRILHNLLIKKRTINSMVKIRTLNLLHLMLLIPLIASTHILGRLTQPHHSLLDIPLHIDPITQFIHNTLITCCWLPLIIRISVEYFGFVFDRVGYMWGLHWLQILYNTDYIVSGCVLLHQSWVWLIILLKIVNTGPRLMAIYSSLLLGSDFYLRNLSCRHIQN